MSNASFTFLKVLIISARHLIKPEALWSRQCQPVIWSRRLERMHVHLVHLPGHPPVRSHQIAHSLERLTGYCKHVGLSFGFAILYCQRTGT